MAAATGRANPHELREDVARHRITRTETGDGERVIREAADPGERGAVVEYLCACSCGWSSGWADMGAARYLAQRHVRERVQESIASELAGARR